MKLFKKILIWTICCLLLLTSTGVTEAPFRFFWDSFYWKKDLHPILMYDPDRDKWYDSSIMSNRGGYYKSIEDWEAGIISYEEWATEENKESLKPIQSILENIQYIWVEELNDNVWYEPSTGKWYDDIGSWYINSYYDSFEDWREMHHSDKTGFQTEELGDDTVELAVLWGFVGLAGCGALIAHRKRGMVR